MTLQSKISITVAAAIGTLLLVALLLDDTRSTATYVGGIGGPVLAVVTVIGVVLAERRHRS